MSFTRTWDSDQPSDSIQMSEVSDRIRDTRVDVRERLETVDPIGSIKEVLNSVVPDGWLECDGSAISRSVYSDLFSTIGTRFGNGNGSTTFNIPDLRGMFLRARSTALTSDLDSERYSHVQVSACNPDSFGWGLIGSVRHTSMVPNVYCGDYCMNLVYTTPTRMLLGYNNSTRGLFMVLPYLGGSVVNNLMTFFFSASARTIKRNGVITSGSAVVTGINGTSGIKIGSPIAIKDFLGTSSQQLATVQSIDSESQITASRNAISSGTYSSGEIIFFTRSVGGNQKSSNSSHSHTISSGGASLGANWISGSNQIASCSFTGSDKSEFFQKFIKEGLSEGKPKNYSTMFCIKVEI